MQEIKEKEKKDLKNRVRKLKKEIEKNDLGELIIDRSKNNDDGGNQIDILAKEFQKLKEENEGSKLANGREEEIMPTRKDNKNPFRAREMGISRRERLKGKRRREKALSWEVEVNLGGESTRRNMLKSSLGNTKEAHLVLLEDFKNQGDVKLHVQLPDYDDFQGCDMGHGGILRQIDLRISDNHPLRHLGKR